MNRREALKMLSVGAGATAISFISARPALAAIQSNPSKKHYAMVIDLRKCNGCKACVVSCGVENGNRATEHRTEVVQVISNTDDHPTTLNLPLLCNHCEDPACTKLCPTGATFKRDQDGIVVVDATVCVGCKYCMTACPYTGVRFINSDTSTVDKCNFCIQRTTQNLLPACVESCTGDARVFGDVSDANSEVSKLLATENTLVLQANKNTHPNVFYIGLTQEEANKTYSLHVDQKWQR